MRDIIYSSAAEISESLVRKDYSAREAAEAFLKRAEECKDLGIYLLLDPEHVLTQAEESDKRRAQGHILGVLDGIPVSIKDNICARGQRTSCASRILENFIAPYDASALERLRSAGAVLFGRTNMDEFAMGSSTENSAFQVTRNPWLTDRVPGGSSGGAAASVAASTVPLAIGSDTGGSIRQPAAFCGVIGIKPTYGRVSRYGLVAFASSLDQIGTFGKSVGDAALLLAAISGHDPRDSTSHPGSDQSKIDPSPVPFTAAEWKQLRVGVTVPEKGTEGFEDAVIEAMQETIQEIKRRGAKVIPFKSKFWDHAIPIYYVLATAEASSNLSRYDGVRYGRRSPAADNLLDLYVKSRTEGFGTEVKRRILLGTFVLSSGYYDAYYKTAQKARKLIQIEYSECFKEVDVILQPTSPTTAFRIGEKTANPLAMYQSDLLTISANLGGVPALSMPAGADKNGLPIGLQLTADHFNENVLLRFAASITSEIPNFTPDYARIKPGTGAIERKVTQSIELTNKNAEKQKTVEKKSQADSNGPGRARVAYSSSALKAKKQQKIATLKSKTSKNQKAQSTKGTVTSGSMKEILKEKETRTMAKKKTKKKVSKKKVSKKVGKKVGKKKVSKKKVTKAV